MSGTPRQWPTLADETIAARATITLFDAIAMALRRHRRELAESQRAYAARRGWSPTHQARLERDAAKRGLGDVVDALKGTGFRLALLPDGRDQEPPADSWPTSELLARDASGRRLPAHVVTHRARETPSWHLVRHGFWGPSPDWTWHRPWD